MYRVLSEEESSQNQIWPEPIKRPHDESKLSNFIKTKSLRDKFRESKNWTIRRSVEKEITSPSSLASNSSSSSTSSSISNQPLSNASSSEQPAGISEGRLARLFSLRRSLGSGSNILDNSSPSSPSANTSTASLPATLISSSSSSSLMAKNSMPRLAEEEEQMLFGSESMLKKTGTVLPPNLPSLSPQKMATLTTEQMKRRHIISSLVHSENNYVATLQRLINTYKKPLEESNPPILSPSKVQVLFHRVPEILHCHLVFRIALAEAIKNWDTDEKIGDVFVASFSKASVLEIYSDFINNFSLAMECAKSESKRKSALADFLQVKQITAHDRVSFFGLMVKPVQRFPQFILLLQDLLKETPQGHPDRMALQLALTTLESLAEMLNERKRESEQYAAFKDKMRNISGKLQTKTIGDSNGSIGSRFLLKEDDVTQLEFNQAGHITRSKQRRLLLLNDLLLCVTVNGRASEVDFNPGLSSNSGERLSLKWAVPVQDVELIDGAAGGTLARLLAPSSNNSTLAAMGKRASLGRNSNPMEMNSLNSGPNSGNFNSQASGSNIQGQAENLAQDMADLMHDFDAVSRIASLIGTMKARYDGLTTEVTSRIMSEIQRSIRQKDEEMSYMDACCLQISVRSSKSKDKPETYTFQTRDPNVKKEWIMELRLAQLALDPNNFPGWDVLEQERSISTKMPLFVKSFQVSREQHQTEVNCGCSYSLMVQTPTRAMRKQTYVWTNVSKSGQYQTTPNNEGGSLRIFSVPQNHAGLKELGTISVSDYQVRTIQFVPGLSGGVVSPGSHDEPLKSDLVWVGTDCQKVLIYLASDPERGHEVGRLTMPSVVTSLLYHCDAVFIGLASGSLAIVRRDTNGCWDLQAPQSILLGSEPVSCLLPITNGLYASCGKRVWVVDAFTNEQLKSFTVQPRQEVQLSNSVQASPNSSTLNLHSLTSPGSVHQMAQSGVGLWVAFKNSSTICLYHTETFRHLQDINIASNVTRVLAARDVSSPARSIHVTAMMASRGLLWVGTNVGIALTVPLPRLEGVPIISGRANISYHAHFGPVTFFLNLQPKVITDIPLMNQPPSGFGFFSSPSASIREESEHELKSSDSGTFMNNSDSNPDFHKNELKKQFSDTTVRHESSFESNNAQTHSALSKTQSDVPVKLRQRNTSPYSSRRRARDSMGGSCSIRRTSKTLPRGFSLSQQVSGDMSSMDCDVFGLYGELLNVRDYDCDSGEIVRQGEDLRKSDPELSTIPYRVSTLDRRVRMKTSRPRSLDMSSWSVESRGSAQTTSSSEAGSERPSPNVSRNASFQSTGTPSTISTTSSTTSSSGSSSSTATSSISSSHHHQNNTSESIASTAANTNKKSSSNSNNDSAKRKKKPDTQRTVSTLMGGRGYINWRRTSIEKSRTSALAQINNCDAFLVIWEMKL